MYSILWKNKKIGGGGSTPLISVVNCGQVLYMPTQNAKCKNASLRSRLRACMAVNLRFDQYI